MNDIVFKMTPEEFIRKVVEIYLDARNPKFYHPNILRGRSHLVSGFVEDLFAAFLAFNLDNNFMFYVDQAVSVSSTSIYPDVVMVKNNIALNFFDVKMDLGWNRDGFVSFCADKERMIENIKGKCGQIKHGVTKQETKIIISENIKYHIVIISELNISKRKLVENLEQTKSLKNVEVYTLSSDEHPNTYHKGIDEIMRSIRINNSSFENLFQSAIRNVV